MNEMVPTWADFVAGWPLFRDPVICGVMAGAALGLLGVYVVTRRMVFVTAVLSQGAGFGVALTLYLNMILDRDWEPMFGAITVSLLSTALFTLRPERLKLSREAVLAMAYVAAGGAAIVLGDRISAEAHDINSILFGSAVLVRPLDLLLVVGVGAVVILLHLLLRRALVFASYDADVARVQRVPVRGLDLLLWFLVALEVSVATRALGALPVFAFAVLPAITGLLLTQHIYRAFAVASVVGAAAGGFGYLFAFFESLPVGAAQTLVAVSFVAVAILFRVIRRGQ